MNGIEKGKSYPVYSGRNFAGRSIDMDIVLSDDSVISRENHFSIVYDPKSITFYLVAGEGRTYLNGEHVQAGTEITDGDEISVGESRYIFTPFCKKGRVW
ncbi:MAG: FHA domain-containing protein [Clostridia bacterium]|nr:FHA domain-containing protein [Clostridia bacterium]